MQCFDSCEHVTKELQRLALSQPLLPNDVVLEVDEIAVPTAGVVVVGDQTVEHQDEPAPVPVQAVVMHHSQLVLKERQDEVFVVQQDLSLPVLQRVAVARHRQDLEADKLV